MLKTTDALFHGFGIAYLVATGGVALFLLGAWATLKEFYSARANGRAMVTLFVALAVAPSLFGFDLGAITLPASLVIMIGLKSASVELVLWSVVSILATWALLFAVWTAASKTRSREQPPDPTPD